MVLIFVFKNILCGRKRFVFQMMFKHMPRSPDHDSGSDADTVRIMLVVARNCDNVDIYHDLDYENCLNNRVGWELFFVLCDWLLGQTSIAYRCVS